MLALLFFFSSARRPTKKIIAKRWTACFSTHSPFPRRLQDRVSLWTAQMQTQSCCGRLRRAGLPDCQRMQSSESSRESRLERVGSLTGGAVSDCDLRMPHVPKYCIIYHITISSFSMSCASLSLLLFPPSSSAIQPPSSPSYLLLFPTSPFRHHPSPAHKARPRSPCPTVSSTFLIEVTSPEQESQLV